MFICTTRMTTFSKEELINQMVRQTNTDKYRVTAHYSAHIILCRLDKRVASLIIWSFIVLVIITYQHFNLYCFRNQHDEFEIDRTTTLSFLN